LAHRSGRADFSKAALTRKNPFFRKREEPLMRAARFPTATSPPRNLRSFLLSSSVTKAPNDRGTEIEREREREREKEAHVLSFGNDAGASMKREGRRANIFEENNLDETIIDLNSAEVAIIGFAPPYLFLTYARRRILIFTLMSGDCRYISLG
jgi:hypothetical protein